MAPRARRTAVAFALTMAVAAGCSQEPAARTAPAPSALPEIALPADALTPLVPAPTEVPTGMVALLSGSGRRDAAAVAAYSADAAAAAKALAAHRFQTAYAAQYADPNGPQVLSVVVAQFADAAGAKADLAGDLAATTGEKLTTATVGEASEARRQKLPGAAEGELVTLRFRQGRNTWLLAYGNRPRADPQVAERLARLLVERAKGTA